MDVHDSAISNNIMPELVWFDFLGIERDQWHEMSFTKPVVASCF